MGKKSLAEEYPELAQEWHPTKNGELTPKDVTAGSRKEVWWQCSKGHEWKVRIDSRSAGNGCPYCSGRYAVAGETDLVTTHPELAQEWHPTKNGELTPYDVTVSSNRKVWWLGKCGHEWQTTVNHRFLGTACPYCAGKKVLRGFNDLQTIEPELAEEWHPTKNGELTPKDVTAGSGKKVWWQCSKGHEWQAQIVSRFCGSGCPYCSGKRALRGFNDLVTTQPKLAKEWHPTKNGELTPQDVTARSNKKVWWQCSKGHEWQASVNNRTRINGTGCPTCQKERHTSFPEQAILYYVRKVTEAENRNVEFGREIDVYLPEYRIGIEYNGDYWHRNKEMDDLGKIYFLSKRKIRIITIKESEENRVVGDTIEYVYNSSNKESLNWAITELFNLLKLPLPLIDSSADELEIYNQYIAMKKKNSFGAKHPNIAEEWHPTKNGELTPQDVTAHSNKRVWWMCKKGHEWQTSVNNRTNGRGCPHCWEEKRKRRAEKP